MSRFPVTDTPGRYAVAFVLCANGLDPDVVTASLGIAPTLCIPPRPATRSPGGLEWGDPAGVWTLTSAGVVHDPDVNVHLRYLLERLGARAEAVRALAARGRARFDVPYQPELGFPVIERVLRAAVEHLGATLSFSAVGGRAVADTA
jgi:hypothetical protein